MRSVPGPINGPCSRRVLRNDSVADVSTIIRAGRSDRTHTSAESRVTSPAWTPHSAEGRPDRVNAGRASPAEAASVPFSRARRPGSRRCAMSVPPGSMVRSVCTPRLRPHPEHRVNNTP
ncbi:hypothetical protein SALBM217S_02078 [Streptomyces griseoloalbus]